MFFFKHTLGGSGQTLRMDVLHVFCLKDATGYQFISVRMIRMQHCVPCSCWELQTKTTVHSASNICHNDFGSM